MQKNILLASNDEKLCVRLKKILLSHGFHVVNMLNDAYSVLRALQKQQVSLCIIDFDLSGLNGLQLAKIISEEKLGPVILISQYAVNTYNQSVTSLFGVLNKPVTEYQLVNTINLALFQYKNRKSLEKELANAKEALENRKIIEKAKGILMKNKCLTEDEAYQKLRTSSMEKRVPMKKVAEAIVLMEEF